MTRVRRMSTEQSSSLFSVLADQCKMWAAKSCRITRCVQRNCRRTINYTSSIRNISCIAITRKPRTLKWNFLPIASLHTSTKLNSEIVSFKLSDIGEGIKEVVLKEWFVEVGDEVAQFDSICEVQSDKASVTITSRYDGVIQKLYAEVDDIVQVGSPLVDINSPEATSHSEDVDEEVVQDESDSINLEEKIDLPEAVVISTPTSVMSNKVLATPAVRHIAKQHRVDISQVQGTGENGRVLESDILKMAGKETTTRVQSEEVKTEKKSPESVAVLKEDKIEPIKGIRKAMQRSMTKSLEIPHFGYSDEYDITKLVTVRKELKYAAKEHDVKLSYMPFILKAVSMSLHRYPILNSSIDESQENIIYKPRHNICIAVDSPHGLLLPCVKDVQDKTILEISSEVNRLQEAGLKNKLQPDDLSGGTFSLSNIGSIGGTYAHPVIFSPQVAIGAIGKIQVVPRFDYDGNLQKSSVMCFSWSADHRIIEGATMARFSNYVKELLENPSAMLLTLK